MTEKHSQSYTGNQSPQEIEWFINQKNNSSKVIRESINKVNNLSKETDENMKSISDTILNEQSKNAHQERDSLNLKGRSIYGNIDYPEGYKPAVIHANFDQDRELIDPARPLTDIPDPAPRRNYLLNLYQDDQSKYLKSMEFIDNQKFKNISKWELIKSSSLAEHLDFLVTAKLIKLPVSFYQNNSTQPILTSINDLKIVDISEIQKIMEKLSIEIGPLYQNGFCTQADDKFLKVDSVPVIDDIHNKEYLDEWESILYPDRFDKGLVNLATDIMAVSIVVHALSQCSTRKSMNYKLPACDILKYLRSYLLSQCTLLPHKRDQLKNISLYEGHVIIASQLLGWDIEITGQKQVIFNISSRSGLFTRYPILSDYYVNGWE